MMNVPILVQREQNGIVTGDLGNIDFVAPFELTVGRNPKCDLHLESQDVSRRHARLCLGPEGYVLEDMSNNGTLTYQGDVLRRGHQTFAYGTHFTIGPFRLTIGRPGQSERPFPAGPPSNEPTPPRGVRSPSIAPLHATGPRQAGCAVSIFSGRALAR